MDTTTVRCEHCGRVNRVPTARDGRPRCGNCHESLPWVVEAGDDDFGSVVEESSMPVLVDLWAPWCGPCRMVSPALERVARDLAGKVKLVKINVDSAPKTSQRFSVQAVPTLLLLDKGEVVTRKAGAAPANTLRAWVEEALGGAKAATS